MKGKVASKKQLSEIAHQLLGIDLVKLWVINHTAVFRTHQTSKEEFFCENNYQLKAVRYFRKKLHLRLWTGF